MSKENKNNGNANGAPRKLRHALAGLVAVGLFASPLAFAGSASAATPLKNVVTITPTKAHRYTVGSDVVISARLSTNKPAQFGIACFNAARSVHVYKYGGSSLGAEQMYNAQSSTTRKAVFRITDSISEPVSCSVGVISHAYFYLVQQVPLTFTFYSKTGTTKRPTTTTTVAPNSVGFGTQVVAGSASATSAPTPGIQASIVNERTQVTTTSASVRVGHKATIMWVIVPAPGVVETSTTLLCAPSKSTKELTDALDVTHKATPANPLGYLDDFSFTSRVPRTLDCLVFTGGSTTYFSNIVKVHFIK